MFLVISEDALTSALRRWGVEDACEKEIRRHINIYYTQSMEHELLKPLYRDNFETAKMLEAHLERNEKSVFDDVVRRAIHACARNTFKCKQDLVPNSAAPNAAVVEASSWRYLLGKWSFWVGTIGTISVLLTAIGVFDVSEVLSVIYAITGAE